MIPFLKKNKDGKKPPKPTVPHTAQESNVRAAIADILALDGVVTGGEPSVIRVQD